MLAAQDNIEKFEGNVQMADVLASIAFKNAVDAGSGKVAMDVKEQTETMKVAGKLVEIAAKLKEQRIRILDEFKDLTNLPRPANMEYVVVEASPREQIVRLAAVGMVEQATVLAEQYGVDMAEIHAELETHD